ncbi:hypothetical protein ACU6VJ_11040 [Sphaerotilus sulfidivorans]|jgi:hypothetical protein|nr:hypothetical protein CQA4T8M7_36840 [Sphaerotilus natans]HPG78699.1 hypothetical protein [Piscinibacter sp.]
MKSSSLLLSLALTLGTYAHAAPGQADAALTGVAMNTAKRLDTRLASDGSAQPPRLSGVPMAVAARHGTVPQAEVASSRGQALSGLPMVVAKRL